jgi:hypothetical protein
MEVYSGRDSVSQLPATVTRVNHSPETPFVREIAGFVFLRYGIYPKIETRILCDETLPVNPITPELNTSAQRYLTRFFTGDFAS